jgi:hypothetical protein
MGTTTAAAIVDRAILVIKAITPTSDTQLSFLPYQNELGAKFRDVMLQNPAGAHRQYQVRATGKESDLEVTNEDVEEHMIELEVVVAYPHDNRWGDALARDRMMDEDRHAIEDVIGVRGSVNFTTVYGVDSTWRGATNLNDLFERRDGVDFLVIKQLMSYWRQV